MSNRDVWGFKLFNGLEIIGQLDSVSENYYNIKNALGLGIFQDDTNKESKVLRFVPLSGFTDLTDATHAGIDLEMHKSNVLVKYRPVPQIAKEYCEATSTIVIASNI